MGHPLCPSNRCRGPPLRPQSTRAWPSSLAAHRLVWTAVSAQHTLTGGVGGTLLTLRASDLLRFGQLHLDEGRWAGQQVVSAGWLDQAVRPIDLPTNDEAMSYGYLWWLMDLDRHDAYAASGAFGQAVVILPALRLVVVMACADDASPSMAGAQLLPLMLDVVIPHLSKFPAGAAPAAR